MKPKTCRVCKTEYMPKRMGQRVCSPVCAMALATSRRVKAERRETIKANREAKEKLKTRSDWMREAQSAFNKFIRLRDAIKPCISCGAAPTGNPNERDAGHYRSRGAAPHLRFDEINCHAQCKKCNRYLAGNIAAYRVGLVQRIGREEVELLEADSGFRSWTVADLKEIKSAYNAKAKAITC